MYIHKQRASLEQHLEKLREAGKRIGFVPTMGALHDGHLSLVDESRKHCDITVVSVFVNPRQFNSRDDFEKYPKAFDKDLALLEARGCDMIYVPDEDEVYRNYTDIEFDLEPHTQLFEGASRPGHFKGMAGVVKILLETVRPDISFFGQKDYQQTLVIKWLVKEYALDTEIVVCPTRREPSGLAMSSRNERLSSQERENAAVIFKAMTHVAAGGATEEAKAMLVAAGLKPDYLEVADAQTLLAPTNASAQRIVLAAAYSGAVRLIDNLLI